MPTPNLGLPQLAADQAQKHVTVNEALYDLDALVQLAVLDRSLSALPGSPADGARYIVAASPTGAWAGHANHIAAWLDGAWYARVSPRDHTHPGNFLVSVGLRVVVAPGLIAAWLLISGFWLLVSDF